MNEYLDLISIFFNEKHLYLSNNKYKNCNECSDHKKFIENNSEIIMSCGDISSDKSKCGNKIRIILPIYNSEKDLDFFKNKLNKLINWDIISKFIDDDPKLLKDNEDNEEYLQEYNNEVGKLKELFNNYHSDNYKIINDNYNKIKQIRLDSKLLLSDIKLSDDISKKKELKQQYIKKSESITSLFNEIKNIKMIEHYLIEEPKIPINNYNKEDLLNKPKKQDKKEKKDKKDKKDKPNKKDKQDDRLPDGSKVEWEKNGKKMEGVIEEMSKNGNSYRICCKPGKESGEKGSLYMVNKDIVKLS
jgi:hypothetical protein